MKSIIYTILFLISIIVSCQSKEEKNKINNTQNKEIINNNFLKIPVENGEVFIGELASINDVPQSDFTITKKNNHYLVSKNFLETDDLDGKKIIIKSKSFVNKLNITYNIALFFNGTEKEDQFISLNFPVHFTIENNSTLPLFDKVKKDKKLLDFLSKNSLLIKKTAFENYLNYYSKIKPEDLKNCCIADYNQYNKLKIIEDNSFSKLDIEKDLATFIDYESIEIDIKDLNEKIIYSKKLDKNPLSNENTIINIEKTVPTNWIGEYKIKTKAISNSNNQEFEIRYYITITDNSSAVLSIGAENSEDYWCEGDYTLTNDNNILHASGKCDENNINDFYLKFENGKYFIKSKRFLNQDWQDLKKEGKQGYVHKSRIKSN